MKINNFDLSKKVLVVAEIGNNHEGNFEVAKELVCKAAECGVDAVKFQTFKTEEFVSKSNVQRFEQLKRFELSYDKFSQLADLARSLGLLFISTPLDLTSADFLENIVDAYKIASGDNNFNALISKVLKKNKPIIISTGMSDIKRVNKTIEFIKAELPENLDIKEKIIILHCTSSYPVPIEQANLLSIKFLLDKTGLTVGYSDHTIEMDAAILAVALGARIIEKHFTLDHNYSSFRDHQLSANPEEMRELVNKIRTVELMLGRYEKTIQKCEEQIIINCRRSVFAKRDLKKEDKILSSDITYLRPSGGVTPDEDHKIIGKIINRDINAGEKLLESYFD